MICPHCGNAIEQQPVVFADPANINACNALPQGQWIDFTINANQQSLVVFANGFTQNVGAAANPINYGTTTTLNL